MRQFHKGQRLIKLCDQQTRTAQQVMSRYVRQQKHLQEEIARCEAELQTLGDMILAQQLNNVTTNRAEIYAQRRQQAVLLHQCQQLRIEHMMRTENLHEVEYEITQCQRQLATLKRKEMKFTQWTRATKKEWLMQRELCSENELQEDIPWRLQS